MAAMSTTRRLLLEPHHLCIAGALAAAVGFGLAVPVLDGLSLQAKAICAVGAAGLGFLLVIPNRRIALVCAWALVFPLSLEKVFPLLHPTYRGFFIPPVVLSGTDLVLGMLILSLLLEWWARGRCPLVWPAATVPFLVLAGWSAVSFLLNARTNEGILQILHWTKMAVFLVVMVSSIRNRPELLTVILAVAAAVTIQAVLVGISYVFKHHFGITAKAGADQLLSISTGATEIVRATGTMGHPNQQAMYQTLFTIPLFALFMVRNWCWRLLAAATLIASTIAIILTFSRTSWISCTLAGLVVFGLAFRNHRITQRAWLGLGAGSLAAVALIGAFSPLILTRLTKADDGASLSRIHLALLSLEHASHHPLTGVGPGNFVNAKLASSQEADWGRSVWLPRGTTVKARYIDDLELGLVKLEGNWYYTSLPAHNKYLLLAAELGLTGLGLFLWYQWRLLQTLLAGLATADPLLWWVGAALVATFAATLVEYMLELFYDDKTMLMPLFANVLMICFGRIAAGPESGEAAP
jgi:hypothetical protein